jgi:hypothetical protein
VFISVIHVHRGQALAVQRDHVSRETLTIAGMSTDSKTAAPSSPDVEPECWAGGVAHAGLGQNDPTFGLQYVHSMPNYVLSISLQALPRQSGRL